MPYGGGNAYVIVNSGFLTLGGNVADGGTYNSSRILQLGGAGNGLFSGACVDTGLNNSGILFGGILKTDAGTWTVSGTNTTAGAPGANNGAGLLVSGGKLVLSGQWNGGLVLVAGGGTLTGNGLASNLTVNAGGIFVPGDYGSIGTFTVSNLLTLSGTMYASLNKSQAQSNTMVVVINTGATNAVANTGSSLVVSNLGPALAAGDAFYLFSQPVTNGNLVTISGSPGTGLVFTNYLAVDGSIKVVQTVNPNPTNIIVVLNPPNELVLSWPTDHIGWRLLVQTNSATVGLSNNWVEVPGAASVNSVTNLVDSNSGSVFYRMVYP